jgi:hypothetical protein
MNEKQRQKRKVHDHPGSFQSKSCRKSCLVIPESILPDSRYDDFRPDLIKSAQSKLRGSSPSPVYGADNVNRKRTKIGYFDSDDVFDLNPSVMRAILKWNPKFADLVDILGLHSTPPRRFASPAYSSEFFSERKTE